ncbi:hypothetical protein ACJJTC_014537 [Scirpophaga incertulas]
MAREEEVNSVLREAPQGDSGSARRDLTLQLEQNEISEWEPEIREIIENYNNMERECASGGLTVASELREAITKLKEDWDALRAPVPVAEPTKKPNELANQIETVTQSVVSVTQSEEPVTQSVVPDTKSLAPVTQSVATVTQSVVTVTQSVVSAKQSVVSAKQTDREPSANSEHSESVNSECSESASEQCEPVERREQPIDVPNGELPHICNTTSDYHLLHFSNVLGFYRCR